MFKRLGEDVSVSADRVEKIKTVEVGRRVRLARANLSLLGGSLKKISTMAFHLIKNRLFLSGDFQN